MKALLFLFLFIGCGDKVFDHTYVIAFSPCASHDDRRRQMPAEMQGEIAFPTDTQLEYLDAGAKNQKQIEDAGKLLPGQPFEKNDNLPPVLIDKNSQTKKLQGDQILSQQKDLASQKQKVDEQIITFETQRNIIWILGGAFALIFVLGFMTIMQMIKNRSLEKIVAVRDQQVIAERKKAQEDLSRSETLYRLLATNSKDIISLYKLDEDPKHVYVSPSCAAIMGFEPEEMIGHSPFDFILPEDAKKMKESIYPSTMGSGSGSHEYRVRKKDGSIIWLETISSPYVDTRDNTALFLTSARDITQRKILERDLQMGKEQAEKDSARLQQLIDEKNDLIGLLSHDLRSPVNQVHGLVNLMSFSLDNKEELKRYIALIEQVTDSQLELLKNLLSMLKIDQLITETESFQQTTVLSLIDSVKKKIDFALKNKNIHLSVDVPEEMKIPVQATCMVEAIQNLVSNAIKFSPPGETVTISAERKASGLLIIVRDNGIGFDPAKSERLFDRFTKERRKGTNNEASAGLGLYLVKKIIENHKGTISAHSDGDGKGSVFMMRFP
jgi:PAS domain S-box-containing protein